MNALPKKIIEKLKDRGCFIAVTDESPPETIGGLFGASKKRYKKGIGHLYKKRRITIEVDGIRLCGKLSGTG